jgi:putative exporter of polyketide antibiotics
VLLERTLVAVAGAVAMALAAAVAVHFEAQRETIDLAFARLLTASILLVPFATLFLGLGAALTATVPRAALAVLGAFAITGYFITELGPVFKWPAWVLDLSPFHLYGRPLTDGVDGAGLAIMLVAAAVGLAAAAFLFQGRDVGS